MLLEEFSQLSAFKFSSIILSIGLIVDTINFFIKKELYYDNIGLFQYSKIVLDKRKYLGSIYKKAPFLFRYKSFYQIMIIRLLCSLIILFSLSLHWSLFLILFVIQLIFNIRNIYSLSGADQMQSILLFGLFVFSLDCDASTSLLAFCFITIQLLVSYFFTGFHKMKSKNWLNGNALLLVLNSDTFGNSTIQKILYKNKIISIFFSWIIILVQISFIFIFFIYPNFTIYYLIILFLFHLSIAFFMNLNHFFWVFISCYPIIYYLSKCNLWNYLF